MDEIGKWFANPDNIHALEALGIYGLVIGWSTLRLISQGKPKSETPPSRWATPVIVGSLGTMALLGAIWVDSAWKAGLPPVVVPPTQTNLTEVTDFTQSWEVTKAIGGVVLSLGFLAWTVKTKFGLRH